MTYIKSDVGCCFFFLGGDPVERRKFYFMRNTKDKLLNAGTIRADSHKVIPVTKTEWSTICTKAKVPLVFSID